MSFLSLKDVTLQFGGVTAVDNVSFEVEEGEVFSLVGPNGAGNQQFLIFYQDFILQIMGR